MAIRIAVVGTGGIAGQHGAALAAHPEARIVAAVDVDRERRETFARRFDAKAYARLDQCISEVDAVYVLTPPGFRRSYAEVAIGAGKHIFCEKPLAISVEDAEAIWRAADSAGIVGMTGFNQRYRLGYRRLHDTVESGQLGKPYHFHCQRYGMGAGGTGTLTSANWRTDPATLCGMTVESLSHDIDLIRWIMADDIRSVAAAMHSTVRDLPEFDNNAHLLLRLAGGGSAVIDASWSSRIGFNTRAVLGEVGTAFVTGSDVGNNGIWCSTELHLKTDADEHERVEILRDNLDAASYAAETNDFLSSIRSGGTPLATLKDGYETVRVSHAALESAAKGTTVCV